MIVPHSDSPRFLVTAAGGAAVSMLNSEQILALTHGQIVLYKLNQVALPQGSPLCTLIFLSLYFSNFLTFYPQDLGVCHCLFILY